MDIYEYIKVNTSLPLHLYNMVVKRIKRILLSNHIRFFVQDNIFTIQGMLATIISNRLETYQFVCVKDTIYNSFLYQHHNGDSG